MSDHNALYASDQVMSKVIMIRIHFIKHLMKKTLRYALIYEMNAPIEL